jgi:hypothetical protein
MTTKVCFTNGTPCRIGAEIANAPLVDCYHVAGSGRKAAAVTPHRSDNFLDVSRKDKIELPALLPTVAVVFTVGGPLVYQGRVDKFAYTKR